MKKINTKIKRKLRNRKKLKKVNNNRYRVSVSKSLKNIFAQIIDDKKMTTLVSASSIEKDIKKDKTKKQDKPNNSNLKVLKQSDQKPEIKKIKKQDTEKKDYKAKDYIVYPKHGVGQILSINTKTIGGIEVQCYDIKFEKDKAMGLLPINKQSHLRPLSTVNQINKSISILKGKPKIKRSMWSRRAQEYEQKITSGKIYDLAEVVRDLNKGDDLMVDQSYSERQLFEKAYERILSEFQIVLNLSYDDIQKKLNKALKRNLETQTSSVPAQNKKIQNEQPEESSEQEGVGIVEENTE